MCHIRFADAELMQAGAHSLSRPEMVWREHNHAVLTNHVVVSRIRARLPLMQPSPILYKLYGSGTVASGVVSQPGLQVCGFCEIEQRLSQCFQLRQ